MATTNRAASRSITLATRPAATASLSFDSTKRIIFGVIVGSFALIVGMIAFVK